MKRKQIIVMVIIIAAAIGGVYAWNEFNRKHKDLTNVSPAYNVQAVELIKEFENNDSVSNQKYTGKVVAVEGIIKEIQKDEQGYYTIVLGEPSEMSSVRCSIDSTHNSDVTSLQKGNRVSVKGSFTGYKADDTGLLGSDVEMNRCVVQKPK